MYKACIWTLVCHGHLSGMSFEDQKRQKETQPLGRMFDICSKLKYLMT
jgi:hypothetical protein